MLIASKIGLTNKVGVLMNKELKKLSRKELLEILLEQTKRIEELEVKLE